MRMVSFGAREKGQRKMENSLDIYTEGNKLVTTAQSLPDNGGYWVPVYGQLDWTYSEDMKLTVEYVWRPAEDVI